MRLGLVIKKDGSEAVESIPLTMADLNEDFKYLPRIREEGLTLYEGGRCVSNDLGKELGDRLKALGVTKIFGIGNCAL